MKMSNETFQGWIGSFIIHVLFIFLLLALAVPEIESTDEFIELSWGTTAAVMSQRIPQPSQKQVESQIVAAAKEKTTSQKISSQPVVLPERKMPDKNPEVIKTPKSEKMETAERSSGNQKAAALGTGDKDAISGKVEGERENLGVSETKSGVASDISSAGAGAFSDENDSGALYSIEWQGGGTRRKLSGDLPKYPPGVNVEAQVRILATVMPDGSVRFVQPAQKANNRLENAAMAEIRQWRFEPLQSSYSQKDQTCEITFRFTLR